jgi:glycosyltransferase involved in cell wall biosynthesis
MGRATWLTHLPKGTSAIHVARLGGFYKLKRYRHAHAWIGNTEAICDYLKENGFPERWVFYIRNFVERPEPASPPQLQALREQYAIPSDALIIVSAGRFVAKKGFHDLLVAFSRLPDEIHDRPLHLIVVGDGPLAAELATFAVQAGIARRVHWTGWQNDPGFFYDLADVFVCPSRHEPLGNVILEAWSHGAAVVATTTHGARALITDRVDGVLVREEDPAALGGAIEALLRQDPRTRAALGRNGQQTVMGRYGGEAVLNEYLDLYRMLTSRS